MDAEDPARRADVAQLRGQAEQPQAEPVEDVIIDHGAAPPAHRFRHDKHGVTAPLCHTAIGLPGVGRTRGLFSLGGLEVRHAGTLTGSPASPFGAAGRSPWEGLRVRALLERRLGPRPLPPSPKPPSTETHDEIERICTSDHAVRVYIARSWTRIRTIEQMALLLSVLILLGVGAWVVTGFDVGLVALGVAALAIWFTMSLTAVQVRFGYLVSLESAVEELAHHLARADKAATDADARNAIEDAQRILDGRLRRALAASDASSPGKIERHLGTIIRLFGISAAIVGAVGIGISTGLAIYSIAAFGVLEAARIAGPALLSAILLG